MGVSPRISPRASAPYRLALTTPVICWQNGGWRRTGDFQLAESQGLGGGPPYGGLSSSFVRRAADFQGQVCRQQRKWSGPGFGPATSRRWRHTSRGQLQAVARMPPFLSRSCDRLRFRLSYSRILPLGPIGNQRRRGRTEASRCQRYQGGRVSSSRAGLPAWPT